MKSPFPGMDPYIEACGLWESFHGRLIHKIDETLGEILPAGYTIDTPLRSYVEFQESFIEIYAEREERILVTCIEVLSPSNKRRDTEGWSQYERKRQALMLGKANFIEIDLLRGGDKMPMQTPWPDCPYTLLVSPAYKAPYCRVWKGHFQFRLPSIPVPLLRPEPNLTLDLQPLIDSIYDRFRYETQIDYTRPLTPLWSRSEAAAVRNLLKARRS